MKIIASIFLILVGFLIVQPAISSNQKTNAAKPICMQNVCSMKKKHCNRKLNDENNDCSKCNPFMACAYGNFFINEMPFEQTNSFLILTKRIITPNVRILSYYIADCWHPPELPLS